MQLHKSRSKPYILLEVNVL